jgi:glycosyltransferase involved in cell wall biosynthesis
MMKILIVINNFHMTGNGMASSARRTVNYLKAAGHEVRVLAGPNPDPQGPQPEFLLKEYKFPVGQSMVEAQGYHYASSDKKVIARAVEWADIVHLEEPFMLEYKTMKIAEAMGKPLTATYHIHPENISCHWGPLSYWKGLNRFLLRLATRYIYNHCSAVQCPTENVLDRMRRYHLESRMEVISNGLVPDNCIRPKEMPANYLDPKRPFKVIYIGRLSKEKDQMTLLESMRYSQYAWCIQLHFAGIGDAEQKIKKKARELCKEGVLKYPPIFTFEDRDGLRKLAAEADLAVHCAIIEVEGLSIMESMQQGVVPVIAEGRYSGTSQFALDRRSVFPVRNPEALANRIDYWLSHPKERWETGQQYVQAMKAYDIRQSVEKLTALFEQAIKEKLGAIP